ncbi:hypothetical protein SAMN02746089_01877 [Caldanaerobius fijiensis DSM 17918]|uniref:Uncharacterized protein n=1 Tax=Caldanaerobius fijiensis DSM 17918 TaxID=1121256 RepID=A0A1M5BIF5_9THEO|nr:hypothetical protein [Caldanaerobius fijiensis]SHF42218.1 hypothetical protein SAMN02746089_01877 [Caldanaerobius fijiensis DSM 17918]
MNGILANVPAMYAKLKNDRRAVNEYLATIGLIALVAGVTVMAIPSARTTIVGLWNNMLSSLSSTFSGISSGQ